MNRTGLSKDTVREDETARRETAESFYPVVNESFHTVENTRNVMTLPWKSNASLSGCLGRGISCEILTVISE